MSERTEDTPTSKRAARSERRRNQTRVEILDAARALVLNSGWAGFSLSAVADELGLTKPALYYYFRSKEALTFELVLAEWLADATAVQAAVNATDNGADALEAMMRTLFGRYRERIGMFTLAYKTTFPGDFTKLLGADQVDRLRPTNDMLYGGAELRLRADQRAGRFPKKRDPRRFAFTALMAVVGVLTMKALTEPAGDPLIHTDDDLIDDLCLTFRSVASQKGKR